MFGVTLTRLPFAAKVFCTLFLLGIGVGSLAAITQVATAIGLSPAEVQASLAPEMPMTHMGHHGSHGEQEIQLSDLSQSAKVFIRTPLLIQTSHTHLFGQTLIAGLLGLVFLFSAQPEGRKALILAIPFVATLMDIGSMWLTRFVTPGFAYGVMSGGSLFFLGYLLIASISLYELWIRKEARA